jgi:hypothetical protein
MFHKLDKMSRDDSLVQSAFDHVGNYLICVVIFAAAAWKQKHAGSGIGALWDHFVAGSLALFGFSLFWMNHTNLMFKIRGRLRSRCVQIAFLLVYSVAAADLLVFAMDRGAGS